MSSPMKGFLSDILTNRVALVKQPANKREYLLTKTEDKQMEELLRVVLETEADNEADLLAALGTDGLDEKTIEVVKAVFRLWSGYADELTEDGFIAVGKSLGYEFTQKETEVKTEITKTDLQNLDAELRSKIEGLLQENEDKAEEVTSLTERMDKMDEDTRLNGFVAKAKEFENTNRSADDLGKMFKAIADVDEKLADDLIEILRSAEAVVKNSDLEDETGSATTSGNKGVEEEVESKTAELVKATDGLDIGTARDRVLRENPELAAKYIAAVRGE